MTIAPGDDHGSGTAVGAAHETLSTVELEVALLLRRADQVTRTQSVTGLDRSAYLVLHALHTHGPLSVTAIADRLGLDGSTVTRQVIALERDGHATRRRDDADRRVVLVAPSAQGIAALAHHRVARRDLYAEILERWTDADREHLAELLARLNIDIDARRSGPARH